MKLIKKWRLIYHNLRHLKVRQFQNEFMKLLFPQKYEQKIVMLSALTAQGRNHGNFLFVFREKRWLHKFILQLTDPQHRRTTERNNKRIMINLTSKMHYDVLSELQIVSTYQIRINKTVYVAIYFLKEHSYFYAPVFSRDFFLKHSYCE